MFDPRVPDILPRPIGLPAILEQLDRAATLDDMHAVSTQICECFDFPRVLFTMYYATSLLRPLSLLISNHPDWWSQLYLSRYRKLDPVARHCRTRSTPIIIGEPRAEDKGSAETLRSFIAEATKAGLASGVAVPIHGLGSEWGMFILSSEQPLENVRDKLVGITPYLAFLAMHMQETARRIVFKRDAILPNVRLTKREKECLLWSAEGKTSWETARILDISERTVIFHVQNVIEKLNVANRTQAVGRAAGMLFADPDLGIAQLDQSEVSRIW